ncbi:hypothetical protein ACWEO4_41030, partial [Streptomyces sp. NPDC004393]
SPGCHNPTNGWDDPRRNVEHDEWIAFPRRYLSEGSMTAIYAAEHADHTTHALPNTPNTTDD